MEATLKKADERIGVALAGDTLVNDWIAKLEVYQWDGEKDITDGINGPAAYAHIRTLKAEAEQLLAEYKQVDFGSARTKRVGRNGGPVPTSSRQGRREPVLCHLLTPGSG